MCIQKVLSMLTMFVFHWFFIILVTSTACSYHLKCPDKSQRPFRALGLCARSFISKYTCLYDTNSKRFSEHCNKTSDYVTRGEKYVITKRLRNVGCSSERYQPFSLWSNVSGVCLYQKTRCEGEGQVKSNNGTLFKDGACLCDYTKGYKFIQRPKQNCFCIPSEEDCSCYFSNCRDSLILSSDYECVDEEHQNDSKCPALEDKSGNWQSPIIKRNNGKGFQKSFNKSEVNTVLVIGFVILPLVLLVIIVWGKVWTSCYTMIPVLSLFAVLLSSFVMVLIFVAYDLNNVAIGVTLLVVSAICGTVYVVYIFSTRQLLKPPQVYDEYYELQIYKLLKAASEGDIKELRRINNQKYIDINDTDYDTRSALHLAACEGHYDAVKYLLKHNAGYLKRKDRCLGHTADEDALWHKSQNLNEDQEINKKRQEIISLLKSHKGVQKVKYSFKDTVAMKMIKAAEYGEVDDLKSLYDLGTDMNLSDPDGRTALHAAAERNQADVVIFLTDTCKVSPFVRWRNKRPVELIKDQNDKEKIADKLRKYMKQQFNEEIDLPMETHDENEDKDLLIVRILNSVLRGDICRIRSYKTAQLRIITDYDKRTALHIAVNNNQEHVVDYLRKHYEQTFAKEVGQAEDRWKKTPVMAAKEKGREKIFRLFDQYCPNVVIKENDEYKTFTLLMAGNKDDVATLTRLYESGVSMNMQAIDGRTALHLAVEERNVCAMTYLIETCNCNMHIPDGYGCTADDIMEKDQDLWKRFEKYHITRALVSPQRSGENVSKSEIFKAAATDDVETLKASDHSYFDIGDYIKNTPLHIAASMGHLDAVRYFMEDCKVSPFIRNNEMKRPVDLVDTQIQFLISRTANRENLYKRKRFTDVRNYLYKKMNDIMISTHQHFDSSFPEYAKDFQSFVLLNKTYKGDIKSVRGCIQSDRSIINNVDFDNRTALHIAVAEQHEHLVRYFLHELKDVVNADIFDRWGNTPIQYAEQNGDRKLLQIFKDNGFKVDERYIN